MRNESMKRSRLLQAMALTALTVGSFSGSTALAWEVKVDSGDTLMMIAQRTRESHATTVEQQALAIFELNPGAFSRQNVNGLLRGASLKMPDQERAEATEGSEADLTIRQHYVEWNQALVVKRGETLMKIAAQTRESEVVTVNQQALALLQLNPHAFTKGNINGLLWGTKLQIPSSELAATVDADTATKMVNEQNRAWHRGTTAVADSGSSKAADMKVAQSTMVTIIRGSQVEVTDIRH